MAARSVGGVVEAARDGSERVLGEQCARYAGFASLSEAAARATRPIARPRSDRNPDVERLPLAVWLDQAGRIRKAKLKIDGGWMVIELSDFGTPKPVQLPDPSEVWTEPDSS